MESDYELLYLAREDIDVVVETLYKKYKGIIYSKVLKYCPSKLYIEEYLNEARLSLYDAVENYQDKYRFNTYLSNCIDNKLLNYRKTLERKKHKILTDAVSIDDKDVQLYMINDKKYSPEELVLEELEYIELKEKIISKLSWKEELIFVLKEQNYTNKEISEITDNSLRTVYNIIRRIQRKVLNIVSN